MIYKALKRIYFDLIGNKVGIENVECNNVNETPEYGCIPRKPNDENTSRENKRGSKIRKRNCVRLISRALIHDEIAFIYIATRPGGEGLLEHSGAFFFTSYLASRCHCTMGDEVNVPPRDKTLATTFLGERYCGVARECKEREMTLRAKIAVFL